MTITGLAEILINKLHREYPDKYRVRDTFSVLTKTLHPIFNFDDNLDSRLLILNLCPVEINPYKEQLMSTYYCKDGVNPEEYSAFSFSLDSIFESLGYEGCRTGYRQYRDNHLIELEELFSLWLKEQLETNFSY